MKTVLRLYRETPLLLNQVLVYCFFVFPIFPIFSSLALIGFSVAVLPHLDKNLVRGERLRRYLGFISIYLIYIIATTYTPNIERALALLVRLLPIPLIIGLYLFSDLFKKIEFEKMKLAYVLGIMVTSGIAWLTAIIRAVTKDSWQEIFYFKLAEGIHAHPVYFSLQILTAMTILLQFGERRKNLLNIIPMVLLGITLFFLQSKLALVLMILLFLVALFSKNAGRGSRIGIGVLGITLLAAILMTLSNTNNRFPEMFRNVDQINIGTMEEDGVQQRKWLWITAFGQVIEKPFFGYGLGAQRNIFRWKVEKGLLMSTNIERPYEDAAKEIAKLNLHNQYLQLWYETGLFGLLAFLFAMGWILFSIKDVWSTGFGLVLLMFLCFLFTENLLDRQIGIYFYSFVLMLFYGDSITDSSVNRRPKIRIV